MASVVRTYEEELAFVTQRSAVQFDIAKGFVPNMLVPGAFYVNAELKELLTRLRETAQQESTRRAEIKASTLALRKAACKLQQVLRTEEEAKAKAEREANEAAERQAAAKAEEERQARIPTCPICSTRVEEWQAQLRARLLRVELLHLDGLVLGVQPLVGAQPGPKVGHARQGGVVGRAQLGRVGHAVEMADRAPGPAQPLGGHIEHRRNGAPLRLEGRIADPLERGIGQREQLVDGRCHMVRRDLVKQRQPGKIK
jgi:hypothetical protein